MRKLFKYDVAISVAEEEKNVAAQIATVLKRKRIRHYYYADGIVDSWGEYLINLTRDAYGKRARYVLIITSSIYVEKYWSNVELQVAVSNLVKGKSRVLQLRLDNTPIDSISRHQVYLEWKNNPEEIAGILEEKIKKQKRAALRTEIPLALCILILALTVWFGIYITQRQPPSDPAAPPPRMEKILIAGTPVVPDDRNNGSEAANTRKIDSFYISNTEVTVAQYRAFCESQQKGFPPQPPSSDENGPVRNVTWHEALDYCKWVKGRLPTEAEWVYAAGAGLTTKYSGGNSAGKVAIHNLKKPQRVGTKDPNAFKIYDMTGNVAEWCDDWYDDSFKWKAVRGGAYNSKISPVNELDLSYRTKEHPDIRSPYIGFRVVWNMH